MQFALNRKSPARKVGGLAAVVALHVLIVAGFMNGLIRAPVAPRVPDLDWVSIVTPKPPTPAPPVERVANPRPNPVTLPQQPVPDSQPVVVDTISTTPPSDTTATADTTGLPGPANAVDTGSPSSNIGIACPNAQGIRASMRYPAQARRDGLQGEVLARFMVAANGEIRNINIVNSSNRAFNSAVVSAVGQFSCVAQGRDVMVEVPFSFRLQ